MLEKVDLHRRLPKEEYKTRLPALRQRLAVLETECWKNQVGSLIVFEGWDASGKGRCIELLTEKIDPRGFRLHAVLPPRTYEQHLPWLHRFWLRVPEYGQIALFHRSWYRRVLEDRVEKILPKGQWQDAYHDISGFERALADDGYVIVKLFLHISRKEQERRLKKLEKDRMTRWQVRPEDWERHAKYRHYLDASEEMLEKTNSEWAPWTIVESNDRCWSRIKVFDTVIAALDGALRRRGGLSLSESGLKARKRK